MVRYVLLIDHPPRGRWRFDPVPENELHDLPSVRLYVARRNLEFERAIPWDSPALEVVIKAVDDPNRVHVITTHRVIKERQSDGPHDAKAPGDDGHELSGSRPGAGPLAK